MSPPFVTESATDHVPRTTRRSPVVLAPYQVRAVETLAAEIGKTQREIAYAPLRRFDIAREHGVSLLTAPTGSGKTLILGRTLEALTLEAASIAAGFRGTIWFWFAPYAGLVTQTQTALRKDCTGLKPCDIMADREPSARRPGDVYVTTWASVATSNREARRLRRSGERSLSLDDLIAQLREDGWFIGCIIDEAHVNFGMNAKSAASFYLEHLRPDITLLATATPKDRELSTFMKSAGLGPPNRIEIARDEVVRAGLNKRGLVAAALLLNESQRAAIDADATLLRAAWVHHLKVKARLRERGITLTPLLLVQIENQKEKGPDPVRAVADLLRQVGVPDDVIRTHTSGSPDPAFHSLAYDEDCEVLIFKVAAATGFDAPRAWTLASLRPSLSPEFGLQVVGRIMRVHPRVRPIHGQDMLLDRAQVFIGDPRRQGGLEAAAATLNALRSGIETLSDQISIFAYGDTNVAPGTPPIIPEAAPDRLTASVTTAETLTVALEAEYERQIVQENTSPFDLDLFGAPLPEPIRREGDREPKPGHRFYDLRRDLGMPLRLKTERMPEPAELPHLARAAAEAFEIDDRVIALLHEKGVAAELRLKELLLSQQERTEAITALLSPAKLARAAQGAFNFNENIDPRQFRARLIERFAEAMETRGDFGIDRSRLGRVIDQIAVYDQDRIRRALRTAQSRQAKSIDAEPLPAQMEDREGLFEALKAAYGVFPSRMNRPEQVFAQFIDTAPGVKWWLRNGDHPAWGWPVSIVLATGRRFFPDFVIAVEGRRALDTIRLVEVKDDGVEGPLNSQLNQTKVLTGHVDYLDVLWVTKSDSESRIERLSYSEDQRRIVARGHLSEADLC
ncbi:DEAD/DEAH box helicase [Asticcacaulis sp. YBE204]|uniref:DEAD/DEAH box helicase n=1 Tax=Asticcacaulis sp. YBE204 TaxID=1282363 RepID=UPI0003C3D824|nr:DEAD/DEAH box helicase family protein [Asticcacaulis sp. YBE204]ESQ80111.1 hypothetical protein AEYBE204_05700 [Asticcacaulis sp. YBE204]